MKVQRVYIDTEVASYDNAEIKAVGMTRRIRDQQYEQLKDKTHAERIAFYEEQARELHAKICAALQEQHEAESKSI